MRTILCLTLCAVLCGTTAFGQLDRTKVFRDTRIVNAHSVELIPKGTMKFIISHRFGALNTGIQELYGLDRAEIRLGLDYAPFNNVNIGFGRSSQEKHYDFYLKYRLLQQRKDGNSPISLVYYTNAAVRTIQAPETEGLSLSQKLTYVHQVLAGRRFNDWLSLQLMPTLVHRNFVFDPTSNNDIYSLGAAGRFQLSKIVAVNLEYFYRLPDQLENPEVRNPIGLGIELETKGHIFQLNFTNSIAMIAPEYIAETTGNIFEGDIHFGFNITRDFKIGHREY